MAQEPSLIRGHPHQVFGMPHLRYHCAPFVPDSRAVYAFSETTDDEVCDLNHLI